jgi:hypothetical protein
LCCSGYCGCAIVRELSPKAGGVIKKRLPRFSHQCLLSRRENRTEKFAKIYFGPSSATSSSRQDLLRDRLKGNGDLFVTIEPADNGRCACSPVKEVAWEFVGLVCARRAGALRLKGARRTGLFSVARDGY